MFILFFLLWLIFNGRLSLELVLSGIAVTAVIWLFAYRFLGYTPAADKRLLKTIPWIFNYIGNLILEIIQAALEVLRVALTPGEKPDPLIIEFHSGLSGDWRNVILANSITLTPGTITVFQKGDFLVVHCLRREYAGGIAESSFVQLLRKLDEYDEKEVEA